jgi:methyl-accepting chemotaxis protein
MTSGSRPSQRDEQTKTGLLATLVPNAIRRRYGLKLGLSLLAVFLVVASVGAYTYTQTSDMVEDQTETALKSTTANHAEAVGEWRSNTRFATSTIADDDVLRNDSASEAERRQYLLDERRRFASAGRSDIADVHVIDVDNNSLVTSTSTAVRQNGLESIDANWTTLTASDFEAPETVWSGETWYHSTEESPHLFAFATPVPENPNQVVVVSTQLENFLGEHAHDGGHSTYVVTSDGSPLASHHAHVDQDALAAALEDEQVFAEVEDDVQAYAKVSGTDWVVVTEQPAKSAYAVRETVRSLVGALAGASLLTLTLVGALLFTQTVNPLRKLRNKVKAMEDGDLNVSLETGRVDELGRLYDGFDAMRTSLRDQIREAERASAEADAARQDAQAMNRHLEQKADQYAAVMQSCADGDLTARMNEDAENEAMTEIAAEFNEMMIALERVTAEVTGFATEVASASEDVTASSEEVMSASERVTESIQEISTGADAQHQSLQTVNEEIEQLSTTTEEIAASSNEVANIAARTAETGRSGRDAARAAIDGMEDVRSESSDAVAAIEELESQMTAIDELIELIKDIAQETNMLALNANIEASRGGTSGSDGGNEFAVVADEVKDLATEAKDAATDIEDRLERIKSQTSTTAEEVQQTSDRIEEHAASVKNAASALDDIARYAEETNDGVQEISAATEQQAASSQEIVAMVEDATEISETTSHESKRVASAARAQTKALEGVTTNASQLATNATALSQTLDRFETNPADHPGSVSTDKPTDSSALDVDLGDPAHDVSIDRGSTDSDRNDSVVHDVDDDDPGPTTFEFQGIEDDDGVDAPDASSDQTAQFIDDPDRELDDE